jgi:2-phosphosulfolactate phosphatase
MELGPITALRLARDGKIVEGFEHGNSPLNIQENLLKEKPWFTTTNARLLHMALENGAKEIITASFPLSAVCDHLIKMKNVVLGCAA